MYDIVGSSPYGREVIDTAETLADAKAMLVEYRLAFGPTWVITMRRARP